MCTYCRSSDPRRSHRDSRPRRRSATSPVCISRWCTWTPSRCTCADLWVQHRSQNDNHLRLTRRAARRTPIAAAATAASSATCTCVATRWKGDAASVFGNENVLSCNRLFSLFSFSQSDEACTTRTLKRTAWRGERQNGSRFCTHLRRRYFNRWSNIKAFNACNALHELALFLPLRAGRHSLSLSLSISLTLSSFR